VSLHAIQIKTVGSIGEGKERVVTDLQTVLHMNRNVERSFELSWNIMRTSSQLYRGAKNLPRSEYQVFRIDQNS
jgi:hypothetical protein